MQLKSEEQQMTRKNIAATVTHERLVEMLDYDKETGEFAWRHRDDRPSYFAARRPGVVAANGRVYIGIDRARYLAHRLAWFYETKEWPVFNVVQKDGDYQNLKFSNLEMETPSQTTSRAKSSADAGVTWDKDRKAWFAKITVNYEQRPLGRFKTKAEAKAAVKRARDESRTELAAGASGEQAAGKREGARLSGNYRRLWAATRAASGGATGWTTFEQFVAEIATLGWRDHSSLEAIDSSTVIGPGNCRWVAPSLHGQFDYRTREGRVAYNRAHRLANPMVYRDRDLRRSFGISLTDYREMLAAQNGVCAICKRPEVEKKNGKTRWLCVDHCHATGAIRGLLCGSCNRGIGKFEDNILYLKAAVSYLERYESQSTGVPASRRITHSEEGAQVAHDLHEFS